MKQKKNTRNSGTLALGENGIWLFKELGIYDEDPEKDGKINEELIKFLASKGHKRPKIKFKTI